MKCFNFIRTDPNYWLVLLLWKWFFFFVFQLAIFHPKMHLANMNDVAGPSNTRVLRSKYLPVMLYAFVSFIIFDSLTTKCNVPWNMTTETMLRYSKWIAVMLLRIFIIHIIHEELNTLSFQSDSGCVWCRSGIITNKCHKSNAHVNTQTARKSNNICSRHVFIIILTVSIKEWMGNGVDKTLTQFKRLFLSARELFFPPF